MEERNINERESLEIITSMIARTKQRYIGDGNILLMWGYLIIGVAALIWVLLSTTHNPVWNWLWFLIWIVGGTLTPIMSRKREAITGVKNYSDKMSSWIWTTVGYSAMVSTVFCLGFMFIKGIDVWSMWFAFALIIVPFAEIAQGIVLEEKSLMAGGSIGLVTGIFTMCCIAGRVPLHADWYLPIFIASCICMMIIPGHIINHNAKSRQ